MSVIRHRSCLLKVALDEEAEGNVLGDWSVCAKL